MTEFREVASGLRFPEGPIAMPDGSVLVVEIAGGALTRVLPDGRCEVVATPGGGPNGAAIGPDGAAYVCNNGGFEWHEGFGMLRPGVQAADYSGGRIERVDLDTGAVEVLYAECDGHRLCAPNDIVFDATGNFWFTDFGHLRERDRDRGGLYYASPDGSSIREVLQPLDSPNGVGLSPDGERLYVADTYSGRVYGWQVTAPGELQVAIPDMPVVGALLYSPGGPLYFDSMGVEESGNVVVATLVTGGLSVVAPDGVLVEFVDLPDAMVTNVCWGGPDRRTAYATLSGSGRLVAIDWPRAGLALAY